MFCVHSEIVSDETLGHASLNLKDVPDHVQECFKKDLDSKLKSAHGKNHVTGSITVTASYTPLSSGRGTEHSCNKLNRNDNVNSDLDILYNVSPENLNGVLTVSAIRCRNIRTSLAVESKVIAKPFLVFEVGKVEKKTHCVNNSFGDPSFRETFHFILNYALVTRHEKLKVRLKVCGSRYDHGSTLLHVVYYYNNYSCGIYRRTPSALTSWLVNCRWSCKT